MCEFDPIIFDIISRVFRSFSLYEVKARCGLRQPSGGVIGLQGRRPTIPCQSAGGAGLCGGSVADQKERDVVRLVGAAREIFDGVQNCFLKIL